MEEVTCSVVIKTFRWRGIETAVITVKFLLLSYQNMKLML